MERCVRQLGKGGHEPLRRFEEQEPQLEGYGRHRWMERGIRKVLEGKSPQYEQVDA